MEQIPVVGGEQADRTQELAELLGRFAELMAAVSRNYQTLKVWGTLLESSSPEVKEILAGSGDQITAMIKEQFDAAEQAQRSLREALDMVAAELRTKGQGFAIQGYEERLSVL